MALNKQNQEWKKMVNSGAGGTSVPLDGAQAKKIDKKFWKAKTRKINVACPAGANPHDDDTDAAARTLYGPKSSWKRYVSVRTVEVCVGPDEEPVEIKPGPHPPLRGRAIYGGKFLALHPTLPVPTR